MIETNMSVILNQERRPDGTTRLTTFVDVVYDTAGAPHVAPLMAAVMELGKVLCKHGQWHWLNGKRVCKGCGKDLPGRQSPELDDS